MDKKVSETEKEIEEKGTLSEVNAIPLILKTMFNHITHIDRKLDKIDERFEKIEERIDKLEQKFEARIGRMFTLLGIGFRIITALIVIFQFIE